MARSQAKTNLKDHGFDFADAGEVFAGPTFTFEDDRFHYAEQRFVTLRPPERRLRFAGAYRGVGSHSYHLIPKGDKK
jgi:uncharacterized DUF497 family protein